MLTKARIAVAAGQIDYAKMEKAKHWFVIDRKYQGRLVDWLAKCPDPNICVGKQIEKPSTLNQKQCSYDISDGNTPETVGSILLSLYTDVASLDPSFLGALRDNFEPSKSSEQ